MLNILVCGLALINNHLAFRCSSQAGENPGLYRSAVHSEIKIIILKYASFMCYRAEDVNLLLNLSISFLVNRRKGHVSGCTTALSGMHRYL